MHTHDDTHENTASIAAEETCTCSEPAPTVRGDQKGAGRTYCDRCGHPVRLAWR
jgi:hypothetical protein